MKPTEFVQANTVFMSPPDMPGSCEEIKGYVGRLASGPFDGAMLAVVAWKPSEEEIEKIKQGQSIFLSFVGSLPPHYVGTSFEEVTGV